MWFLQVYKELIQITTALLNYICEKVIYIALSLSFLIYIVNITSPAELLWKIKQDNIVKGQVRSHIKSIEIYIQLKKDVR